MPRCVLRLILIFALFSGAVLEGRAFVQFAEFFSANATFASPTTAAGASAATTTAKIAFTASKTTAITRTAAAKSAAIRWGPATGAGPLGEKVVATFRGGSYTQTVTTEATTLYRAYGGTAGEVGGYWTRTAPTGPLQARIDSALAPQWGNTAGSVSTIRVPAGTTIFEGFAAPQGNLIGGGSQVFIQNVNPAWLVK
jgi:hypothetical protein